MERPASHSTGPLRRQEILCRTSPQQLVAIGQHAFGQAFGQGQTVFGVFEVARLVRVGAVAKLHQHGGHLRAQQHMERCGFDAVVPYAERPFLQAKSAICCTCRASLRDSCTLALSITSASTFCISPRL